MTDYPFCFKCNQNCISCINKYDSFYKRRDPPLKSIKETIDNINPKEDYFGVGGGEPTLRKEFFEILEYARKKHSNMYIFVTTNGRMFYYKDFARKLNELNLGNFMLGMSIYGHNKEIHESITRTKGSFKQTVIGIKNLLFFNIPVEVRVIINRINYMYLEEIANFISKEFKGIERLVFINMKYTGNALVNREKVSVNISEVVPFVVKAVKALENKNFDTRFYHFPLCILPKELWCMAKGVTKRETEELTFVEACKRCKMIKDCPRIWKTYVYLFGDKEFKAIN